MTPRSLRVNVFALLVLCSQLVIGWSAVGADDATPAASPIASPTAVEQWPSWIQLGPNDVILARAIRRRNLPPDHHRWLERRDEYPRVAKRKSSKRRL